MTAAMRALSLIGGDDTPDPKDNEQIINIFNSDPVSSVNLGPMSYQYGPAFRRNSPASELLYLVLEDGDRARRALLLLLPVALAFVAVVASLVIWAILQPDHASMIGALLGGGILFPITRSLSLTRNLSRRRRRPRPNATGHSG